MRVALVVLSLSIASLAHAAGFATVDQSVVSMATGGTGTARAEDPAAASYNPAAVLARPGLAASIGAVLAASRLSASADGWSSETVGGPSVPPHAHLSWAGERFAAGASFTVPFGSRVEWPADWPRRFDVLSAGLSVLRLSAFGGVRFGPVSIAAGPFVDLARLETARAIDFIAAAGSARIETSATGFGAHAGLFVAAGETLDLGLSYRSRSELSLSGFADFDVPPELRGAASDQAVTSAILLPDRIAVGMLWRVREDLELAVDLEAVLWTTVDELVIDFADEGMNDVRQPRDWDSTLAPRIGATWRAFDELRVRGGLFLDPSPTPAETVGPSSPDSTRLGITAGASYALPAGLELSVAYQRLQLLGATGAAVRFGGSADLVGLALAFRL